MAKLTRGLTGAWLGLAVLLSGCTLVGGHPEDPGAGATAPEAGGGGEGDLRRTVYGGSVTFDGDRIPLTLEIVARGGDVSATLTIPSLGLDAGGGGETDGDRIDLDLSYPGSCPGRLRVEGTFREARRRVEGRLTASDCTGEESGALVLLIRPGG